MRNISADTEGYIHRAVIDQYDAEGIHVMRLYFGPYTSKTTAKVQVTRETNTVTERRYEYGTYKEVRVRPDWTAEGQVESTKLDWAVDSD